MPPPPPTQPWKQGFSRRLGYYLLGISLGLVMLGVIWQIRDAAARRRQLERQVVEQRAGQAPDNPASPSVQPPAR